MNDTTDPKLRLIFGRRSIRVYSPGDIPPASVTEMLRAAMAAPSAMTKDPWRFITVRDKQMLRQLASVLPGGAMLSTASMAIVACGDLDAAFERNLSYLLQDCSASIQNLLLAAAGLGVGACWVGVHPSESGIQRIRDLFHLPAPIIPVAVISLGMPGEQPPARTRYIESSVHSEEW